MNRKQLIILLVLVVVVGGIGLALYNKSSESYIGSTRTGQKLLGEFNVNDVTHIRIKQDTQEINLAKTGDKWTVKERGNYPANFEQISDLVRKSADLKVVQTMPVGPSQRARLGLAETGPNAATLVEFKGAGGKEVKSFYLGAKHMRKPQQEDPYGGNEGFPDGRYMLTSKTAENVSLTSEVLSNAEPKPEHWVNKDFFEVDGIKSISVTALEPTNSWKISREDEQGTFQLVDIKPGEIVDTNQLSNFGAALSHPSFHDVAVDKSPEETGLNKPTTITVTTFHDTTYTLQVGALSGENHYLKFTVSGDWAKERVAGPDEKPDDKERFDKEFKEAMQKREEKLAHEKKLDNWVYLVPKFNLEQVLKNRADLMEKKKDETVGKEGETESAQAQEVPNIVPAVP